MLRLFPIFWNSLTFFEEDKRFYRRPILLVLIGSGNVKRKNGKGVAQSDLEKAEEFNGQFTDVFSKNEHTQVPVLGRSAPFMNDSAVSKDGVIKLLKGLNPSKALGPDELHPRVLKELATELGPVFAHLFQQSIDTGETPKEWSLANIAPSSRRVTGHFRAIIARFP